MPDPVTTPATEIPAVPQRRIRPDPLQPVAETAAPVVDGPGWVAPFRADGFSVYDREGRLVCMCNNSQTVELRTEGASIIAAALNAAAAA